jgi:hypothetical protein
MFSSLLHTTTLALALSGLSVARDIDLSLEDVTDAIEGTENETLEALGRNATLNLYPASNQPFRYGASFGCKERTFNTLSIAPETCLSGDYYLSLNMLIAESPVCDDGSEPVLQYYHSRGCEGKPQYDSKTGKGIPDYCLWGGHSPKYWSMIFRCRDAPSASEGVMEHQTATPPPAPFLEIARPPFPETARPGEVTSHLFPACNGQRVGGKKSLSVPADTACMTTPGLALQINKAAVCANGTRAQLAQFTDSKCGRGGDDAVMRLVDLADSDIGTKSCISTGAFGADERYSSMAFWCDGIKPKSNSDSKPDDDEEETPDEENNQGKKGSVSESACMTGKAPFFNHPATDTCVNLKSSKLKIYTPGVCANGTAPLLALYSKPGCLSPQSYDPVSEDDLETCLDMSESGSFAFYCTGDIQKGDDGGSRPLNPPKQNSGSILHFLLVLFSILMFMFLVMVLSVWAWVRKYGGSVNKLLDIVKGFMKRDGGEIAL